MEVTTRIVRRGDAIVLALAIGALAYFFYVNAQIASRVIDGTRYYWLDDDMMISMTYARNLAEGHGLVWNAGTAAGDRVEGYTNFLWTIIMALVHKLGASDPRAALHMKIISFGFTAANLVLALRLLRIFAPRAIFAAPLLLTTMVMCPDIIHWSAWGFETALMTFLYLVFLIRLFRGGEGGDVIGFVALSLIPLVRADGLYIFMTNAIVALVLATRRKRELVWLALAFLPCVLHFAFRRWYYGDWLPNTYYLKVYGLEEVHKRGYLYARGFLLAYPLLLILAAGSALMILRRDRRAIVLFVAVPSTLAYVVQTGGDMFYEFRFFAHLMPLIFVFATLGMTIPRSGAQKGIPRLVWAATLLVISIPLLDPLKRLMVPDTNGDPDRQTQVALVVKKNALPESRVVVLCAGIIPYFSRLRALDMVGKSDKHIARLTPFPHAMIGHGKLDPKYTLDQNPDFVVSCSTGTGVAQNLTPGLKTTDPLHTFLASEPFRTRYLPNPVELDFLKRETALYTYAQSPEFPRRGSWKMVNVVR